MKVARIAVFSAIVLLERLCTYSVLMTLDLADTWVVIVESLVFLLVFFLCAKWYFKQVEPTLQSGLMLGFLSIFFMTAYKYILGWVGDLSALDESIFMLVAGSFGTLTWWWFAEIVLLSAYVGFEFDGTYSPDTKK